MLENAYNNINDFIHIITIVVNKYAKLDFGGQRGSISKCTPHKDWKLYEKKYE